MAKTLGNTLAQTPQHISTKSMTRSLVTIPSSQRLVLDNVSWQTYLRLLRAFDDRHLRITYTQGTLEIMTLSPEHERFKHLLGYLIGVLVEELGWNMAGFGSMTFKRSEHRSGLEPDECYWIQSEHLVRSKDTIDLRRDPPPDLVIEIDVTHSSLDRLSIYTVLGVPEIWRFNGQELFFHLLSNERQYMETAYSRAFPFLAAAEVERFLKMRFAYSETELIRRFRAWVQEQIAKK
jgi:Uma2 family endonuclease